MERDALEALYIATGGADYWRKDTNWLTDAPLNTWHGVETVNGRVMRLHLSDNGLTGEISAELGNLTRLTELWLGDNDLSGEIPSELSRLIRLESLNMGYNRLTGAIPAWLGELFRLEVLNLSGNQFSGDVPAELGRLSELEELFLDGNMALSGTLPEDLTEMTSLYWLWFHETGVCAPIDENFQAWLLNLDVRSGPNCPQ